MHAIQKVTSNLKSAWSVTPRNLVKFLLSGKLTEKLVTVGIL